MRMSAHVGTTDVDIIIGLAVADETPETYRTPQNNLEKASFRQQEPSFCWAREVDGVTVLVEFLCEIDQVQPGRIFRPKGEYTGAKLGAVTLRVANILPGSRSRGTPGRRTSSGQRTPHRARRKIGRHRP